MAAALFESLIVNHPFVDGKKRVAFFTTDVFLCLNGCNLHVDAKETLINRKFPSLRAQRSNLIPWNQSVGDCFVTAFPAMTN